MSVKGRVVGFAIMTLSGVILTSLFEGSIERQKRKRVPSAPPFKRPVEVTPMPYVPSNKAVFAQPGANWRRAKESDVTPNMRSQAIAALSNPLGAFINHDFYGIAIETHYDSVRGEHKGASIFVLA